MSTRTNGQRTRSFDKGLKENFKSLIGNEIREMIEMNTAREKGVLTYDTRIKILMLQPENEDTISGLLKTVSLMMMELRQEQKGLITLVEYGRRGYVLDDVWEKCEQYHDGVIHAWHDERFEEDELWKSDIKKTDYELPFVNIETFNIKRYSFKGGRSFICITKQLDDALPLGRANRLRFMEIVRY
ncbi:hypothetical protein Tco_0088992 [Tanacetum coccineum]